MSSEQPTSEQTKPVPDQSDTRNLTTASRLRLPFAIVLALTALSGLVHGLMDGRWTPQEDLIAVGSRLNNVPVQIGRWMMVEDRELEENAAEMLRCYGSDVRVYQDESTGSTVTVALLFGPRGPIAVHVPEICFSSVGTEQVGDTQIESIKAGKYDHSLWSVKFSQDQSPDPTLDVWYGWSTGNQWIAAKYPRVWMTDTLYKVQIAGDVGQGDYRPCRDFLENFLPQIENLID